ncbi:hypothetical protein [Microlunatus sp. Y2014]|uniref:hypothetical protein n=1 Tax=Microlunatus sp. Y2014 TaxID=3418488 RepID=UPI003DA794D2
MFAPIRRDPRVPMASAGDGRIASYEGNATTSPVANEEFVDLLQAWRQGFTGSAFDFDYHLMWQYAFDPGQLIIARTLYDDIRGFHGIGLDGLISCQTQRIFVPDGFVLTIMARTLWDPSISYEQAHAEHLAATFGPDGAAVGQHLQRLSDVVAGWDLDHRGVCQPRIDPAEVSTVRSMLTELMELCHRHLADDQPVWATSWQNLLWYSEVWTGLCGVWDALAANDRSVLWQRWDEVKASLWQGQDDHQPVLDASNLTLTIERFLDRVLPAGTAAD